MRVGGVCWAGESVATWLGRHSMAECGNLVGSGHSMAECGNMLGGVKVWQHGWGGSVAKSV